MQHLVTIFRDNNYGEKLCDNFDFSLMNAPDWVARGMGQVPYFDYTNTEGIYVSKLGEYPWMKADELFVVFRSDNRLQNGTHARFNLCQRA